MLKIINQFQFIILIKIIPVLIKINEKSLNKNLFISPTDIFIPQIKRLTIIFTPRRNYKYELILSSFINSKFFLR